MAPLTFRVGVQEIERHTIQRLVELYSKLHLALAKETMNTLSIELPPIHSVADLVEQRSYCYFASTWQLLPWLAYLGDGNYTRLLRGATMEPTLLETGHRFEISANPEKWRKMIRLQLENLHFTCEDARVGRRMYEARKHDLIRCLGGNGE